MHSHLNFSTLGEIFQPFKYGRRGTTLLRGYPTQPYIQTLSR